MSRFNCKVPFVFAGGIFLLSFVCVILAIAYPHRLLDYLACSCENPTANLLVVEGWVNEDVLEQAYEEYTDHSYTNIFTTGYAYTEGWLMGSGGRLSLVLTPGIEGSPDSLYTVSITARGTKAEGEYAHFVAYADSTYLGEDFSMRNKNTFLFQSRLLAPPDTIHIYFDNDFADGRSDRNLFFYAIQVNQTVFPIEDERTICYEHGRTGLTEVSRGSAGTAENAAGYLIRKGIPEEEIIAVTTNRRMKSKTFTMALDVREQMNRQFPGDHLSFTLVSQGIHARRSYISYKKAFGRSATIGVLAVPENATDTRPTERGLKKLQPVVKELVGILFAYLCL